MYDEERFQQLINLGSKMTAAFIELERRGQTYETYAWLASGYNVEDLSLQWYGSDNILGRRWQISPSVNNDNFTRLITTA